MTYKNLMLSLLGKDSYDDNVLLSFIERNIVELKNGVPVYVYGEEPIIMNKEEAAANFFSYLYYRKKNKLKKDSEEDLSEEELKQRFKRYWNDFTAMPQSETRIDAQKFTSREIEISEIQNQTENQIHCIDRVSYKIFHRSSTMDYKVVTINSRGADTFDLYICADNEEFCRFITKKDSKEHKMKFFSKAKKSLQFTAEHAKFKLERKNTIKLDTNAFKAKKDRERYKNLLEIIRGTKRNIQIHTSTKFDNSDPEYLNIECGAKYFPKNNLFTEKEPGYLCILYKYYKKKSLGHGISNSIDLAPINNENSMSQWEDLMDSKNENELILLLEKVMKGLSSPSKEQKILMQCLQSIISKLKERKGITNDSN